MDKQILKLIPKKPFDTPDLIQSAKKKKFKVSVYFISEKSWIDIGQWDEFNISQNKIKLFNNL